MLTRVELPQVGETVTEGVLQRWLKRPGERVEKYEPLAEVVTDKVTMEVPSPVAGVVARLLVQEGETVPMGSAIAEVETGGVALVGGPGEAPPAEAGGPPTPAPAPPAPTARPEGGRRLSPLVRRLVAEYGLSAEEVAQIRGTGAGGRITKEDVLRYLEGREAVKAGPPSREGPGPDEEWLPLTPVRRAVAENMARAAREVPMAWTMVEVDVTGLVRWRQAVREEFQRREGVELTYLPFIVKAVVESLKEHPLLNSTWGGDRIVLKRRINIGIAVAAPQGLVVPVVHDADRLSIAGLARAIRDLVEKARANKLELADVQGGTFTVNNTGVLGSVISRPILNYPQAAILTTEAVVRRPVVVDDAIAIRYMMNMCVTFDHRVLDGEQVGAFLQSVKRRVEAMGPSTPLY